MLTQIINGHILTPQGWLKDGSVLISDGKILEVTNSDLAVIGATVIDAKGMYIVPGFVSMHAHGGAGHDFTEGTAEAFQKATQAHLTHGATSIFPTLSSTSFDNIKRAVNTCEELMKAPGSIIQGLHIEGPYLNKKIDKEKKKSQTVDNYRCNKRKEHEEGITISVRRSLIVRMRCCRTIQ